MPIFKTHIYLYKITNPIRFVDFSFGEMRIYSLGDFFSFIFSLIFGDFLLDLLTKLQEISFFNTKVCGNAPFLLVCAFCQLTMVVL